MVVLSNQNLDNSNVQLLNIEKEIKYNYAYFPVVFLSEHDLLKAIEALKLKNIIPRRYFYPSLNKLPYVSYQACPISESIASRIMCLPLFHDLLLEEQDIIVDAILESLK